MKSVKWEDIIPGKVVYAESRFDGISDHSQDISKALCSFMVGALRSDLSKKTTCIAESWKGLCQKDQALLLETFSYSQLGMICLSAMIAHALVEETEELSDVAGTVACSIDEFVSMLSANRELLNKVLSDERVSDDFKDALRKAISGKRAPWESVDSQNGKDDKPDIDNVLKELGLQ